MSIVARFFNEFLHQKKVVFEQEDQLLREWVRETKGKYGHAFVTDEQLIAKERFDTGDYNQLLMRAMKYKPNLVGIIFKRKIDPNVTDIHGHTCLRVASHLLKIHSAVVMSSCEVLIALGADIDRACTCCSTTPLLQAVRNGNYELVELLVKNGAQDGANKHGDTALLAAQRNMHHFRLNPEKKVLFEAMNTLLSTNTK